MNEGPTEAQSQAALNFLWLLQRMQSALENGSDDSASAPYRFGDFPRFRLAEATYGFSNLDSWKSRPSWNFENESLRTAGDPKDPTKPQAQTGNPAWPDIFRTQRNFLP